MYSSTKTEGWADVQGDSAYKREKIIGSRSGRSCFCTPKEPLCPVHPLDNEVPQIRILDLLAARCLPAINLFCDAVVQIG